MGERRFGLGFSGVVGFLHGQTVKNVPASNPAQTGIPQTMNVRTIEPRRPTGALFFRRLHEDLKIEAQGNPLKSGRRLAATVVATSSKLAQVSHQSQKC